MFMNKIEFKINRELSDEELAALEIVKILKKSGYETYWTGGAVRDLVLDLAVHDIDIATSALPEEIRKILPDSYDRGKSFGVMAVKVCSHEFEVATFRSDIGVADHRRPKSVEFVSSCEDAARRDFTINGLFYDPIESQIIDFVDGLTDLKRGKIRFIGDPEKRIDEDYLRMLRAVRFAVRLDFKIEENSYKAIQNNFYQVKKISTERVRGEFSKIILQKNRVQAIKILEDLKILEEILPELKFLHNVPQPKEFHSEGDCWTHTMLALKNLGEVSGPDAEELVWAVLLHDIAKPETIGYRNESKKTSITFFEHDIRSVEIARQILERFKFSNHFIEKVCWAISQHMRIVHAFRGMSDRKQKKLFVDDNIQLLLDLTKADLGASLRPNGQPEMKMYEDAVKLKEKFEVEASALEKSQAKKFDLVTGRDIIQVLKIEAGPEVGRIKKELEQAYLDGKINTRPEALKMLEKYQ